MQSTMPPEEAETWTYAKLTEHINKTAESAGFTRLSTLTKTSIKNILDAAEIKPFRIQYYCEKRDPDFEEKMQDVHTFSYDEKPGIQAISTTGKDLNPTTNCGTIKRDSTIVNCVI